MILRLSFLLFFLLLNSGQVSFAQTPDYSGSKERIDTSSGFILIGDVQLRGTPEIILGRENNKNAVCALFDKIATEDPSFVLILGDLTFPGSSLSSWRDFDNLTKPVHGKGIPIFPLPGNHEYFGDHTIAFNEYFARFPNTRHELWYSKRWKDIGIITLNANFSHLTKNEITEERSWYLSEMDRLEKDSGVAMIIVCCHQPPFTNSSVVSDDRNVQKYFVPPYFKTQKAKLFFSGHCHSYEHFKIDGKDFVVSGGGGPRQDLRLGSNDVLHHDLFSGGSKRKHHYCMLIRSATELRMQMKQVDEDLKNWSIGEEINLGIGHIRK